MIPTFVYVVLILCAFALGRASTRWTWARPADMSLSTTALANQSALAGSTETRVPMNGERLFMLVFLSGWIVAWTVGVAAAFGAFVAGTGDLFGTLFLGGWLMAAVAAWVFVANTVFRLATGKRVRGRGGRQI